MAITSSDFSIAKNYSLSAFLTQRQYLFMMKYTQLYNVGSVSSEMGVGIKTAFNTLDVVRSKLGIPNLVSLVHFVAQNHISSYDDYMQAHFNLLYPSAS